MVSATGFASKVTQLIVVLSLCIPLQAKTEQNNGIKVLSSDLQGIVISYKPVLKSLNEIKTPDGRIVLMPIIAGATEDFSVAEGAPLRLITNINITIPSENGFHLEYSNVSTLHTKAGVIAPKPTLIKDKGLNIQEYIISDYNYNTASLPEWTKLEYSGIARGRHIAALTFTAARYNPQIKSIEIPSEIVLKIRFDSKKIVTSNTKNDGFDIAYTINHEQAKNWTAVTSGNERLFRNSTGNISELSSGTWIKVRVDNEGMYRIDASQLSSLGASVPRDQISTIKMFSYGGAELSEKVSDGIKNEFNEQPIIVETNGNGDLANITFYGSPAHGFKYNPVFKEFRHYINHYSNDNYYLLTWGGSQGKRAEAIPEPSGQVDFTPIDYIHRLFFEEEIRNSFTNSYGSGRTWFGTSLLPKTYSEVLHNLDKTGQGGKIKVVVSVAHNSSTNGKFSIKESGNTLTEFNLNGFTDTYTDAYRKVQSYDNLDPASIAGDNRIILNISYNNSSNSNSPAYFDWLEVHYPRNFVPIDNEIGFFSDPTKEGIASYSINGFSGKIYGFDVTDPASPKYITNSSVTGGLFLFKSEINDSMPKRFFVSSKIKAPEIQKVTINGIRNRQDNAEMIVITHPDLIESANAYKKYRSEQNKINVVVVSTADIYTEFGSCIGDPTAIRDYIAHAYNTWDVKPKYVLLWGDGHYDYKGILNTGKVNYVPPYETSDETLDTFNETYSHTTDDFYAKVEGNDDRIDIAIGRLTVDSPEAGFKILNKIKKYENTSSNDLWRTIITLMADDGPTSRQDSDGFTHGRQSEELSNGFIPDDFQQKKIYLVKYPTENVVGGRRKPAAMQDLVNTVNTTGTLLLNWIGHGSPRVWAHEEAFERNKTTEMMNNMDKLFFVSAATCDFGRFDMTDLRCGAEELVMNDHGGAIAAFSATRVVFSSENAAINKDLFAALLNKNLTTQRYPTLGEAMFILKQKNTGDNDRKYYLLGDPSLRLNMPENVVKIETINDKNIELNPGDTVFIKALSTINLTGRIIKQGTDETDNTFNGSIAINMFDSDVINVITDNDGIDHYIKETGGALNRSSYEVKNGVFEASYVIPKDILFSGEKGRLFTFAYSDDDRYAKGNTRAFIIDGIDTISLGVDSDGPSISVYLDSRTFQQCDVVSPNPILIVDLKDKSGINTTGKGIGHRIEAWIDDDPVSYDLTDKFTTSLKNSGEGTAQEMIFGLPPGEHNVKVRAWDVYNNYTIVDSCFRIAATKDGVVIEDSYGVPNPFSLNTTIKFYHNMSGPFTADLYIYNLMGQIVRNLQGEISTLHIGEMNWDGLDNHGNVLPNGAYYYRLVIQNDKGNNRDKTGSLTISR